jgi:hypothetical protein
MAIINVIECISFMWHLTCILLFKCGSFQDILVGVCLEVLFFSNWHICWQFQNIEVSLNAQQFIITCTA